ncbi:restriction endonuclease subunit S [Dyadobacter sp. CY326]|uniref:restriction endonuclease subunit S n=1 Tax=Dyadobacter sp. CY326 TaxID=2907300 RepID=UPI001F426196|nr:restriction endonuclease subunit S [Dyadobacter sp. CY326]MCE7064012.1 restriction endonuclease subunit S [Dyadobacter sp. CY326]
MENLVPKLRFPEFESPWEQKKLGEVLQRMQSGISRRLSDTDIGYAILRSNNIFENKIVFDDLKYWYLIDDQGVDLNKFILQENDILVNFINSLAQIGKAALFKNRINRDVIYTTNLLRLTFKNEIFPEFIISLFYTKVYRDFVTSITKPAVNQASFTTKEFQGYTINFPSLPEQTKIAEFLTAIDKRIELLTAKKEKLTLYKKGAMQKIFNQKIRFKQDDCRDFPEWTPCNAGDLFASVTNKNHNSDLPILAITQEHGAIPRNLIDYNISVSEKSVDSYKVVEKGDFIISLRSFQGGIEYSNYLGICSPAYIILKPKVAIVDQWFKYFFKTDSYIVQLNEKLEGIRDGKMISYKYFSETRINLPSLKEQTKISEFILSIDAQIQKVEQQIILNQNYKKGLLQQMFV